MHKILLFGRVPLRKLDVNDLPLSAFDVYEATRCDDAMQCLQERVLDLILVEVEANGDEALKFCERLKEGIQTRGIPLVLLLATENQFDNHSDLLALADDYLIKPVSEGEIAARIHTHLRTSDFYEGLTRQDLMMLLELTEIVSVTRNPEKILATIVDRVARSLNVRRCSIIKLDDEGQLVVKASNDLESKHEIKLQMSNYPEIEQALTSRQPVVIQDVSHDPLMLPVRTKIQSLAFNSIVVVPIIKKQSVIGTFFLRTTSPLSNGTERVFKLCQIVANISGNALENAILFETLHSTKRLLEDMAVRDGLTRLYNSQHFYARLEDEFSRASRYQLPLSCLFLDLDNFKELNDTYGHIAGDVVLRQVGLLIMKELRHSDVAARYGGEEFAVLLPSTDCDGAYELAERLRRMISKLSLVQLKGGQVTASIGVSTYVDDNLQSAIDLIKSADHAMYEAKNEGMKNCVRRAPKTA